MDIQKEASAYIELRNEGLLANEDIWALIGKDPELQKKRVRWTAEFRASLPQASAAPEGVTRPAEKAAPVEPAEPVSAAMPDKSGDGGEDADIQAKALNGAQAQALQSIVESVATGAMPKATAKAMAQGIFPTFSEATINAIFDPIDTRSPSPASIPERGAPSGQAFASAASGGWDESQHPRADDGKFGAGGGGKDGEGDAAGENIRHGREALAKALETQGDVSNAMHREDVGNIDFVYGTPGDPAKKYKGGFGISHIREKHGDKVLKQMPEVIAKGEVKRVYGPRGAERVELILGNHGAVLSKGFGGKPKNWLVTGWNEMVPR